MLRPYTFVSHEGDRTRREARKRDEFSTVGTITVRREVGEQLVRIATPHFATRTPSRFHDAMHPWPPFSSCCYTCKTTCLLVPLPPLLLGSCFGPSRLPLAVPRFQQPHVRTSVLPPFEARLSDPFRAHVPSLCARKWTRMASSARALFSCRKSSSVDSPAANPVLVDTGPPPDVGRGGWKEGRAEASVDRGEGSPVPRTR